MATMVRFYSIGGPEVLRLEDSPRPEPESGEVGVEIKSIGVNRGEIAFRSGKLLIKPELPCGLGFEGAGVVFALGPGVTDLEIGQRVSILPAFVQGGRYATYATHGVFPRHSVISTPDTIDDINAAAIWVSFLTAWGGLIEIGGIRPGDFVAISAGSSSVGLAAIQVTNVVGAVPIAITRTTDKRKALREAGAQYVIASNNSDVTTAILEICGDKGVRVAFDAIAGPFPNLFVPCMAEEGIIFVYGGLSDQTTVFDRQAMCRKGLSLTGYAVRQILQNPDRLARGQSFILSNLANGLLAPVIDRVFSLDDVVAAHQYMESNAHVGKIVMTV
jgi:NADPH:quinone reductase-like Zn-dependent oxidoreductase